MIWWEGRTRPTFLRDALEQEQQGAHRLLKDEAMFWAVWDGGIEEYS